MNFVNAVGFPSFFLSFSMKACGDFHNLECGSVDVSKGKRKKRERENELCWHSFGLHPHSVRFSLKTGYSVEKCLSGKQKGHGEATWRESTYLQGA